MMMNLSVYLPSARMFVAVLIVLAVTSFVFRSITGSPTSEKIRSYLSI